jgi:hypothetical protein
MNNATNKNAEIYKQKIFYYSKALNDKTNSSNVTDDKFQNNDIFTKLYSERTIYEKLFNMFIDKFMIHAIAHANEVKLFNEQNIKLIICGGKSLEFYFNTCMMPNEFKSFDYDLHIIGHRQKKHSDLMSILHILSDKCNHIFKRSQYNKLYITLYNKLVREFNRQSKFIELMEIDTNTNELFIPGYELFGRQNYSVYIKITYKFKNSSIFAEFDTVDFRTVFETINGSCDGCDKYRFGQITKDEFYTSGFGIIDICYDDEFPLFGITKRYKIGKYLIRLNEGNVLQYEFRSLKLNHYEQSVEKSVVYLPDFDIAYYNVYINSMIPEYVKSKRNGEKIKYFTQKLRDKFHKYINFISVKNFVMNQGQSQFELRHKNTYKPIIDKLKGDTVDFFGEISEHFGYIYAHELQFIIQVHDLLLLSTLRDSLYDENVKFYCDYYDRQIGSRFNYRDPYYGMILDYYVNDSSRINVPLILQDYQKIIYVQDATTRTIEEKSIIQYTNDFLFIMDSAKVEKTLCKKLNDFYVYSVSQTFAFEGTQDCRLQVGDQYTFPSFKSTTYARYYSDHSLFIGYDNQPFVMRIHIDPNKLNCNEFIFMGTTQFEVVLAYGSSVKITDLSTCYMYYGEQNLYQSCLLIDCELLISEIPRMTSNGGGNKKIDFSNDNNDKSTVVPNNENNSDLMVNQIYNNMNNTMSNINIDKYIEITNEKIKNNKLILLDANADVDTMVELDRKNKISYKIKKYNHKLQNTQNNKLQNTQNNKSQSKK